MIPACLYGMVNDWLHFSLILDFLSFHVLNVNPVSKNISLLVNEL